MTVCRNCLHYHKLSSIEGLCLLCRDELPLDADVERTCLRSPNEAGCESWLPKS